MQSKSTQQQRRRTYPHRIVARLRTVSRKAQDWFGPGMAKNLIDYLTSFTPYRKVCLSHSILRDEISFMALEAEWEDLFRRAVPRTPFLRYFWLRLCWERQRSFHRTSLFVVVVRRGDRPVLIAPFVRQGTTLSFLDSVTPQYNDVLVEDSVDVPVYVDYLWSILADMRHIRRFVSKWVRGDSPLVQHLATARQLTKVSFYKAPFIDLAKFGEWQVYLGSLSKKLRLDHGRQCRRLAKHGAEFRISDSSTYCNDIAWLFSQKRQWLDRKAKPSTWLKAPGTEELFTAAAREGIGSSWASVTVLRADGGTIAAVLAFREDSTLYLSKIAYDPAWHTYSPARTLLLFTIERAFQDGIRKVDLMIGRNPLKVSLATGMIRGVRHRKIWLPSVKSTRGGATL
jgi:CelD/BcsL family acetyltransferase involved in cellulose biosynthesis